MNRKTLESGRLRRFAARHRGGTRSHCNVVAQSHRRAQAAGPGTTMAIFARVFARRRQEKPVLVSAGADEEAAPARVVNG